MIYGCHRNPENSAGHRESAQLISAPVISCDEDGDSGGLV